MNTPVRTTNLAAVISRVFGIVCWFAIPFVGAIIAIVCGHVARGEIRRAPPGTQDGDGMAMAGLILGYLHLAFLALALLFVAFFVSSHLLPWHWR